MCDGSRLRARFDERLPVQSLVEGVGFGWQSVTRAGYTSCTGCRNALHSDIYSTMGVPYDACEGVRRCDPSSVRRCASRFAR